MKELKNAYATALSAIRASAFIAYDKGDTTRADGLIDVAVEVADIIVLLDRYMSKK